MPDYTTLDAHDPHRRPTWKWDLAIAIHEGELDRQNYNDPAILTAVDFLEGLFDDEHALIETARKLHHMDNPQRWEIEARLLTGESDIEITTATGIDKDVIHWFEQLFFQVRDCLGKLDYLMANVIGFGSWQGFRDDQLREFWLWMAMNAGPVLLNDLIPQWQMCRRSRGPACLSDYFRLRSPVPHELQAFVAGNMIPLGENTAAFFVDLDKRLLESRGVDGEHHNLARLHSEVVKAARRIVAGKSLSVPRVKRQRVPLDFDPEIVAARGKALQTLLPAGVSAGHSANRERVSAID